MTLVLPNPEVQVSTNEDAKIGDTSLQAIKQWLVQQPHLPDTWDDAGIMTFLRWGEFSLEKTKKKLDAYFTMRTAVPEFFSNRNIKSLEMQEMINVLTITTIPTLTVDGHRVLVLRTVEKPPLNFINEVAVKLFVMIGDIRLIEEPAEVVGDVFILDASTFTAEHYTRINPAFIKKTLICIQEAYPERIKQVHIINAHPLIDRMFGWMKLFLNGKLRNRFHFHSHGLESLYTFIPKNNLPEEYGGTASKLQHHQDDWIKKLEEYTPWFQEQENIKADESKRPGKSTDYEDLFGMDGSFKQRTVD